MNTNLEINDVAESLLILNKTTVDRLFNMDNCSDCVSLYMFYYKTAKWQKTNCIKAVDLYTRKCLKWGSDKLRKTKQLLKSEGLIDIVQDRNEQNIVGWYIKVNYIVPCDVLSQVVPDISDEARTLETYNTRNLQHSKPTSRFQKTNALKDKNKMLKEKSQNKNKNNKNNKNKYSLNFEKFWDICPRKNNKERAYQKYNLVVKSGVSEDLIISKMQEYANYIISTDTDIKYTCTPIGWLSAEKWKDEVSISDQFLNSSQIDNISGFDMW